MRGGSQIRVLLAESNRMHCDLLGKAFCAVRDRFDVVASVSSSTDTLAALHEHRPHVVVIGCDLQDGSLAGMQILPVIHATYPSTRILVTIGASDQNLVIDAFKSGADGVFSHNGLFDQLCKAIEVISRGQIWATTEQLRCVLDAFAQSPKRIKIDPSVEKRLTKREREVVFLAVEGVSNRKIGVKLGLTEHTVKNYLFRVFDKLGVSSRVELVLYCLRQEEEAREENKITLVGPKVGIVAGRAAVGPHENHLLKPRK